MRFLTPANMIWATLIVVPVLLYLFRLKPKTVEVSTLNFFKTLARAHRESPWLRWLKHLLSFLLTALVILGLTAALMRPVLAPPAGSLKNVVLLIDRSASMGAREEGSGPTLLQEGLDRLRDRVDGLPRGVGVLVIAYDQRPEIILPRTMDRRRLARALNHIEFRPIEGRPQRALRLARRLAGVKTPAAVWHLTDTAFQDRAAPDVEGSVSEEGGKSVEVKNLTLRRDGAVNAGITAFELRRLPLEHNRFEAFVGIQCTAPEMIESELEVRVDGRLRDIRKLELNPGSGEKLLLPLQAEAGKILTLHLSTPGDSLSADDRLHARIPSVRPMRVLWVTPGEHPFTELALTTLGQKDEVEIFRASPEDWPTEQAADVVLFQGWLPGEKDEGSDAPRQIEVPPSLREASFVAINPPRTVGGPEFPFRSVPLQAGGLPVERVRSTDDRHALLYGVAAGRIALRQTTALESAGSLQPLWIGPTGPLLLAGESHGRRIVVMGFEPEASGTLPLTFSFPILMGNVVYWCTAPTDVGNAADVHETGRVVSLEGRSILWEDPGSTETQKTRVPLPRDMGGDGSQPVELDRVGLFSTDAGEEGSAVLLSPTETKLASGAEDAPKGMDVDRVPSLFGLSGELTRYLLWAVLLVLVAESWLMHRYSVY